MLPSDPSMDPSDNSSMHHQVHSEMGELELENLSEEQQQLFAKELIRNTPEYKAAWELELWKKREKQVYKKQLEQKEKQHLKNIEIVWREDCTKKEKAIDELRGHLKVKESKYSEAIEEMDKREKQLALVEQELRRRKSELESDYQRKIEHMEHVIKMEKESFQQRLQLETTKNQELQKRIDQQLSHDVVELNEKITKLQIENESLESKLHQTTNSKQSYKLQWKKCQEELQKTKKKHETEMRKFQQKILALQTLQHNPIQPPIMPTHHTMYPVFPNMPSYPHPFVNPYNQPANQSNEQRQEDEISSLKKMIGDLIKSEEDKKHKVLEEIVNTSHTSSNGSSSHSPRTSPKQSPKNQRQPVQPQRKQTMYEEEESMQERDVNITSDITNETRNYNNDSLNEANDERGKELKRLLREKARLLKSGIYNSKSDIILEIEKRLQSLQ